MIGMKKGYHCTAVVARKGGVIYKFKVSRP
jgi:hypothetical protein